jgi:uracil phosphoribosyltransferase
METDAQDALKADLHAALQAAATALLHMTRAAGAKAALHHLADLQRALDAKTHKLALFVTSTEAGMHLELAAIPRDRDTVFTDPMLAVDGSFAAAFDPLGTPTLTDRSALN